MMSSSSNNNHNNNNDDVKCSTTTTSSSSSPPTTPATPTTVVNHQTDHHLKTTTTTTTTENCCSEEMKRRSLIVELNVGGTHYTTSLATLTSRPDSLIARLATEHVAQTTAADDDATSAAGRGRCFVDRDGQLFRYVLDFLRTGVVLLPDGFRELQRLHQEAEYYQLADMVEAMLLCPQTASNSSSTSSSCPAGDCPGYITVSYRGTFGGGRADGLTGTDIRFRKVSRILVCGRISLCRRVFGDTLNDSRNPDRGPDERYSARFYLKHAFIEQAFDALQAAGFRLVAACGTGTNCGRGAADLKPGADVEECRWNHYNEFVFCRGS